MAAGTGYVLGIDLGTTFTAAAAASEGRAEIISLGHTSAVVPSVVLVRDDGEVLVGEAAERRADAEPSRVGREFKRRLGDPVPLVLGGTPFGAEALTAHLLRSVYDRVVEQQGGPPEALVITHPANYGGYKLDLVREAIRLADVPDVQLLSEPEAAATHYAQQDRLDVGDVVAVYDFGGGTFDAAVLRVADSGFEIIGTPEGMERLGGIDFDQAVYAHVMNSLGDAADDLDPADPATASALARLRDECRSAKEALSSDTDTDIPVLLPNLHTEVRLTRVEFEAMIRPRIGETIDSLTRAIRSAGLEPADVSKVLLVGGSSRIPLVAEMVSAATGRPVAIDAHPKHAIALGAALHADDARPSAVSAPLGAPVAAASGVALAGTPTADAATGTDQAGAGAPPPMPPPTAPEPAETEDPPGAGRRRTGLLVAAVIAVLALAAASFVVLTGGGDGESDAAPEPAAPATDATDATAPADTAAATDPPASTAADDGDDADDDVIVTAGEIILEPLDEQPDDAFTESVAAEPSAELLAFASQGGTSDPTDAGPATTTDAGSDSDSDSDSGSDSGEAAGPTTLVALRGSDPGIYGGTRDEATCDPEQLVTVLDRRPEEAAAWAGVHEIDVAEIPDYVDTLTALNLTADTRVTNHGFIEGEAIARQSVLQVGTAVLVDEFGVPRVRCSSGSPLLPPEAIEGTTAYRGPAWDTFDPVRTAAVAPAPEPVAEFEVVDVAGGDNFVRPTGTSGATDRGLLPGEVLATGPIQFPDSPGAFDVNVIEMIFSPDGGPVVATFEYSITVQGVTVNGAGDLTGEFDPVTNTMSGTGFGTVTAGGFGGGGEGGWSATVAPEAGIVTGTAGDADGQVSFELTFEPYTPPT